MCEILSVSCLRGWIDFLFATRWSTPFMEIIIPIPYSIFHTLCYVIYDLEGSNDVNLQSTEFDPCRKNLLSVRFILPPFCLVQ